LAELKTQPAAAGSIVKVDERCCSHKKKSPDSTARLCRFNSRPVHG